MPPALKAKQFGLPRWVWLVAIIGGVGGGLYIRSRRQAADVSTTDPSTAGADPTATDSSYDTGNSAYDNSVPVGFYDATSGASLPDVAGADTVQPFDYAGFLGGLAALGIGANTAGPAGKRGPKGNPGRTGKPGKNKAGKNKGGSKPPTMGGGGPPKKPAPKVKAKPKHKAGKK